MIEIITTQNIEILLYVLLFIAGLFIGSFLNVVSDRVVKRKSILWGRSECDHCKRTLKPGDLIPLFSYVMSGGKCRFCDEKLSLYYPLSEILTGVSFVGVAHFVDVFANAQISMVWVLFAYFLIVFGFYIVIFLTDLKYWLIPNRVVIPAILFVLLFLIGNTLFAAIFTYYRLQNDEFGRYLLEVGYWNQQMMFLLRSVLYTVGSALGLGVFFYLLTLIKGGKAMGGGDVKLAFLIGLFNVFPYNVLAIFLGFLFGASTSLFLIGIRKKTIKDTVPFGPFLIIGSVVALFWGPMVLNWYLSFF